MNNRRRTLKDIVHKYGGCAKVPVWIRISKNVRTKAYYMFGEMPTTLVNLESLSKLTAPEPRFHLPVETRHIL